MISLKNLLPNKNKKETTEETGTRKLDHLVLQAQTNLQIRNDLLVDYQPFILKSASKACKRYVSCSDDEYSVALEAFNESINQYDKDNNYGFLSFASMVIRRRVIDYIRKEIRQTRDIYLDNFVNEDEEDFTESPAHIQGSLKEYQQEIERNETVSEIEEFEECLADYQISLADLVDLSPKHNDARENAKQVAKVLADNPELVTHLTEKKQLPIKELLDMVSVSRKTVERNRKYIIALTLIHIGGYSNLKEFIEPRE